MLHDELSSPGTTYDISDNTIERDGDPLSALAFSAERVQIIAGVGDDTIHVNAPVAPTDFRIDSGMGNDVIDVIETAPGHMVSLDGVITDDQVEVNADGMGNAVFQFSQSVMQLDSLEVGSGGVASLSSLDGQTIRLAMLSIADTGAFDLRSGNLILDYDGLSPLHRIASLLTAGYASGTFNGMGVSSSVAGSTDHALGYAESGSVFASFPAMFAGQAVDSTAILIRYTRFGDADLNGVVNLLDFNRLAANFNGADGSWSQGDFTYDRVVNLVDFNALAANFNKAGAVGLLGLTLAPRGGLRH